MLSKLKLVRLQKGFKAREVAEKLKVSPAYVSKLENGSAIITPDLLEKLAQVYGTTMKELV